jgi:polyisoprenyl-phosphate glycosyltransferase
MQDSSPTLSVVVPVYNEQAVLPLTAVRLRAVLDGLGESYEVLFVNDGSTDATPAVIRTLMSDWPQLRLLALQRNSGHQAALTAGLSRAFGRYVVSIDADLQDPPETIPEMLAVARAEGVDVVYAVRDDRSTDTPFKRHTARLYYRLMRRLVGAWVPAQAGDFRLLSRQVVDELLDLPEQKPVYRLVVPSLGFASAQVRYVRAQRAAGETKYPLRKMVALAVDSITRSSATPLRLATWLGLLGFVLCVGLVIYGVVAFAVGRTVPGWTSMFVAILFLGAVQLVCVGLLGEYVARIYGHLLQRPAFRIATDSAAPSSAQVPRPRAAGDSALQQERTGAR